MHDLRWDQHAAAVTHAEYMDDTRYDLPAVKRVDELRTVPMPDLRSADARTLDAAARQLDTRTADQKIMAELVRIVDALQAVVLRLDTIEERLREVRG